MAGPIGPEYPWGRMAPNPEFDPEPWTARLEARAAAGCANADPAHDLEHVRRVVREAGKLAALERADLAVVLPAAWLHDLVNVPKSDPRRVRASRLSAEAAAAWLREAGYPADRLDRIAHAIEAHSFSAGVEPRTPEAMVVQDADRLDALGAIGIARCFATGGTMRRRFYDPADPFAGNRPPDDATFTVDHFYAKLFRVAETLRTEAGRAEGRRRAAFMRTYLEQLDREIRGA